MKSHIRVLRVDDHSVIREGIVAVINGQPDMQVVAQTSNGPEAVECFVRHRPDITLMDLTLTELFASVVHQVNEILTSMLANAQAAKRWLAAEPPNLMKAIASIDRIARDAREFTWSPASLVSPAIVAKVADIANGCEERFQKAQLYKTKRRNEYGK